MACAYNLAPPFKLFLAMNWIASQCPKPLRSSDKFFDSVHDVKGRFQLGEVREFLTQGSRPFLHDHAAALRQTR